MPTVAILGRPNVGKSTLFNRLTGTRRALVHDEPGVTRDRIEGSAVLDGLEVRLLDTAGLDAGPEDSLAGRLREQTMAGLAAADLALLLIDARAGVTPLDREVAGWLRRSGKPVLVVANKAEGRAGAMAASEAWSLGLGEPIPISAEHAEGIGELAAAIVERLGADAHGDVADGPDTAAAPAAEDDAEWIRLAVVGRPNVGKSSLVNRLIAQERLLTGPEPGLTRDSVQIAWEWAGRRIELVDTAGLRRRARIEAPVEKLAAAASLRAIRAAHVVLLMVDATAPLEHQDLAIAGRVVEEGRALVLAANKWDLVGDREAVLAELRHRAAERLAQLRGLPVLPLSVRTGQGLDRLMPLVIDTFERWRRRVPTPAVNRWLAEALERHAPPLVQGRRLKLRFATQTTNRPPTFVLFANKPASAIPESYLRFLAGSLRDAFDLDGVPLRLRIRHGANPYEERKR